MKYFGTDGIRGVPNEKLTPTLVTKMGMALSVLECKEVVIATDTRLSKDMLWTSLATGAMSVGLNVKYVGVMPTPALIYYSFKHKVTGVIITASHNPYTDNGIKILNRGYKLNETEEFQIEEYIDACNESFVKPKIGCLEMIDVKKEYYQFLQNHMHKTNLKIAIDCANGATSVTAPEIFKEITDQLIVISNQPDGYNINKDCGSTHLNLLIKTVVDHNCDLGFAFDGDGDRVLCVDSNGKIIDGDKLIYLLALYLKSKGKLRKNMVVLSIMSNLGLIESLSQHGIHAIETNVGDKYIIEALNNNKLSLGGENSGHIILPQILHTGDGLLNSIFIVNLLTEANIKIEEYFDSVIMYSDKMVNIKVNDKSKVLQNLELSNKIEQIKRELDYDCKVIVRASGTEDVIRVSVMAKEQELVNKYINELVSLIQSI